MRVQIKKNRERERIEKAFFNKQQLAKASDNKKRRNANWLSYCCWCWYWSCCYKCDSNTNIYNNDTKLIVRIQKGVEETRMEGRKDREKQGNTERTRRTAATACKQPNGHCFCSWNAHPITLPNCDRCFSMHKAVEQFQWVDTVYPKGSISSIKVQLGLFYL